MRQHASRVGYGAQRHILKRRDPAPVGFADSALP
jgi:hypothetical protein